MAIHLVGHSEAIDSATLTELAAIPDDSVFVNGDDIRVPSRVNKLLAAYFGGASITLARLQAPSLEKPALPDLEPLDRAAAPSVQNPPALHVFRDHPYQLEEDEGLRALAAEDGAGATRTRAFYWLWDGNIIPVPEGPRVSLRWTDTTAAVAEAWTNIGSPTFDQTLQSGWYAAIGFNGRATGGIAHRYRFTGQWARPGALMGDAVSDTLFPSAFRNGAWGTLGVFKSTAPPSVDVLENAASTDHTGVIDAVFLGKEEPSALIEALAPRQVA